MKKSERVIARSPNVKCMICNHLGTEEKVEQNGKRYLRVIHDEQIHTATFIGTSLTGAINHVAPDDLRWPTTPTQFREIIDDIREHSKILTQRRYAPSRKTVIDRLFLGLPVDKEKSEKEQLNQYDKALNHIVDFVHSMDDKRYPNAIKHLKPEFVNILRHHNVWRPVKHDLRHKKW
jgi:hypothetical protein